jgi:hypothetical protein
LAYNIIISFEGIYEGSLSIKEHHIQAAYVLG